MDTLKQTSPQRPWALITGCSTGIGRALIGELLQAGFGVVATARNTETLKDFEGQPQVRILALDVRDQTSIQAAREACEDLQLTTLINNAGYGQMGPLELLTSQELRDQFETNVIGLQNVTNAFLSLIRQKAAKGEGRIVHVASVLGRLSIPMAGAYNASKHAVVALAESLRLEVTPDIQVMVVEPGAIKTAFRPTLKKAWGDMPERAIGTIFEKAIHHYASKREDFAHQHGLTAETCARIMAKAISKKRMPRRLIIGKDSFWAQVAHRALPAALFEYLVRRSYGLVVD